MLVQERRPYPANSARVLLYLHSTSSNPPDVDFTISEISLETLDGRLIHAAAGPIEVNALTLAAGQILLKEVIVEPGAYRGIRIGLSSASIRRTEGRASLSVERDLFLKENISLSPRESQVVSLAWDPDNSVEKGYRFAPSMSAEAQTPSSRSLLVFVSNSGSNYISVIDRSLERVIGAITVDENPEGMALNSTQDLLYVVNSSARTISVIDTAQLNVIETIPLMVGLKPTDTVFMPDSPTSIDGRLYIINRMSNDVTVVGTSSKRVIKTIPVGTLPSAIAADAARREVYVANERSNNLTIIRTSDDSVAAQIPVDKRPMGIIPGKDKLYVLNEGSYNISVVSPSLRKVTATIALTDPPERGIRAFDGRLYVANTTADSITFLSSLDVMTRTIKAGGGPIAMAG
ncbi:MAG: beta-propeller fold lactonase family protein, partial [Deltaproteobacteria bacterium]